MNESSKNKADLVLFAFPDGEIISGSDEEKQRGRGRGWRFHTISSHRSHSEYINRRAEGRRQCNFPVFWHDKAEAVWRMLPNEGDATTLERMTAT